MMMECNRFQDLVTDYLEGTVSPRLRAECASHRLICRDCRDLYDSVRATVRTLNECGDAEIPSPAALTERIISATRAGDILGCAQFDQLIELYFDGVILAPNYHGFQHHFLVCPKCRRLIAGIEEAIGLCQEMRESEVEVPVNLPERIIEITTGRVERTRWSPGLFSGGVDVARMAVAALIIAASGLLILSRYGSIAGMASHASLQVDTIVSEGQAKINRTSDVARGNFVRLSREMNQLIDGADSRPEPAERARGGE
jgi:predicted anti-sigma-YlaC factor YlaD